MPSAARSRALWPQRCERFVQRPSDPLLRPTMMTSASRWAISAFRIDGAGRSMRQERQDDPVRDGPDRVEAVHGRHRSADLHRDVHRKVTDPARQQVGEQLFRLRVELETDPTHLLTP